MSYLRATKKVLARLSDVGVGPEEPSVTALGDWYVNRIVVGRRPLLVIMSSESLLPMVQPARDVSTLAARLPGLVRSRLERLGIASTLIEREVEAMVPVQTGPTLDRSVLGSLMGFCHDLPYYLPVGGWTEADLVWLEAKLGETPCRAGRGFDETIWPNRRAVERIWWRWSEGSRE